MSTELEAFVAPMVDMAMQHKFRLELAHPGSGQAMSPEERRAFLTQSFVELAKGMGRDLFALTPAERLDQFSVMAVISNHDTGGLLRSLVNSFMIAYACPETSQRAFKALVAIEGLRAEVADTKGQGQMSIHPRLAEAARALDAWITEQLSKNDGSPKPAFRVLVGADRLYVKAHGNLPGIPAKFMDFIVEQSPVETVDVQSMH